MKEEITMKLITIAMFLAVLLVSGLAVPERESREGRFEGRKKGSR